MKKYSYLLPILFIFTCMLISCKDLEMKKAGTSPPPSFNVGVKAVNVPSNFPFLQSFTWARQGNLILLFGGRTEGFHGQNQLDTIFKSSKANTSIYVINLQDFSSSSLALDLTNPNNLFFTYSNSEFWQSGDTLFVAGGFGQKLTSDIQSNHTANTMMAISVSKMISQVQTQGNPQNAILSSASSPYVQVTGGEMIYANGWFYLLFGQNYDTVYTAGTTGAYTSAVRKFKYNNGQVLDTLSYNDSTFHRRDLNMAEITQSTGNFWAAFGGVFTSDNNGYLNPVYIHLTGSNVTRVLDTLVQKTNQYNCATASIYDPSSDACFMILFGGIGQYQYLEKSHSWENGDHGAKLPFVNTITQLIFNSGAMHQNIQLPPGQPTMPALCGANAIFFPNSNLISRGITLDYTKFNTDTTNIGFIYGGIASPLPTSSSLYPSTLNKTLYQVLLYKTAAKKAE